MCSYVPGTVQKHFMCTLSHLPIKFLEIGFNIIFFLQLQKLTCKGIKQLAVFSQLSKWKRGIRVFSLFESKAHHLIYFYILNCLFTIRMSYLYIYLNYKNNLNRIVESLTYKGPFENSFYMWKELRDLVAQITQVVVGIARLEPHIVFVDPVFCQSTLLLLG